MPNEMKSPITDGFHLVVDALKLNGVDTIFGVAGIPITDLARLAQAEGLRYIGFRHEQSAGNAAAIAGYLTKKPGICLTVSAPGFLNGMVALANATTNGFPMIQISGSSDRAIVDLQQGDYEELDQMNAAKPYTKASFRVSKPEDIGTGVARAIHAAVSGRPGGVYLDLTAEVLGATLDTDAAAQSLVRVVEPAPRQIPDPESIKRALDLLASAQRPLIILGKGAAYAQADDAIRSFVEKTGIPFLPMSMAKGLLPDNHKQSAAAARSLVLSQADVVMLIGARLNWLLAQGKGPHWSPAARFVQIDISPTEIDSNRAIAAPVVADIGGLPVIWASSKLMSSMPCAGRAPEREGGERMSAISFEDQFLGFLDGAIRQQKRMADRAMVQFIVLRLLMVAASASLPALTTIENRVWSTVAAVLVAVLTGLDTNFDGVRSGDTGRKASRRPKSLSNTCSSRRC